MKHLLTASLLIVLFIGCKEKKEEPFKIGIRRDQKTELTKAAEAARAAADGNFQIHMYGDTAFIAGNLPIEYHYHSERKNKYEGTYEMKTGVWYWTPTAGHIIEVNNYKWILLRDTFIARGQYLHPFDTAEAFKYQRMGLFKRVCVCDSSDYEHYQF